MSQRHNDAKVISGRNRTIVIDGCRRNFEFYQLYKNHFYGLSQDEMFYADFKALVERNGDLYLYKDYYRSNGIEAIEIIDEVMDYYDGRLPNREVGIVWNILKYLLRYPFKGQRNSDIDKIIDYTQKLKEEK